LAGYTTDTHESEFSEATGKIIKQLGTMTEIPEFAALLEEIVGSQHHRSFSVDWPFEEPTRCLLLNRIAQPQKLIYSLICLHLMLAFRSSIAAVLIAHRTVLP